MFSTHLGQYAPRPARSVPIVLRSSPEDDQESMVKSFRKMFPAECKAITIPIKNIHRWFDPYDLNRHGAEFLRSVLTTMGKENSLRAQKIAKYAEDWRRNNPTLFSTLTSHSQDIFTAREVREHDSEFLAEVYQKIIYLRSKNAIQYGSSRSPEVSDKRRVVSYPLRSEGSFANPPSQQTRCNSLGRNLRGSSYVTSYPGPPLHPDDTKVYFKHNTRAKAHVKHTPNPNLNRSQAGPQQQRDIPNYDAEYYSPHYTKRDISRPFEIGSISTFQNPTQYQNMADTAPFLEAAHLSRHPQRPSSNDARVLEREEANSRLRAANESIDTTFLPQLQFQDPMHAYYEQAGIQSSASFHQQHTASVKNDPPVVFARDRSGNSIYNDYSAQGQYQRRPQDELEHHHKESLQAQMQPRHLSISASPQEANKPNPVVANAHLQAGHHQLSQTYPELSTQTPRQSSYPSSQYAQSASTHFTNHSHEHLPFPSYSTRSDERGLSGYSGEYRKYDDEKLFLSGMPPDTSEDSIRQLFGSSEAHISSVSETKVSARPPHYAPYSFVFVTFNGADQAANAKEALTSNPPTINGRKMTVNYAFVRSSRDFTSQGVSMNEGETPQERTNPQRKKAASSASVRPNQIQLTETSAATKVNDPTITMNEKRSPQKVPISSTKSGHSQKTSAHQKRDIKLNAGKRKSGTGSLDAGRAHIETLHNQQKPEQGSKDFPPLVTVQREESPSKTLASQPVAANSTLSQLQTLSTQKKVRAKENAPLVSKSDNKDRGRAFPVVPKDQLEMTLEDSTSTPQPSSSETQLHQAQSHASGTDIPKLGVTQVEVPVRGTEKAPSSTVPAGHGNMGQAKPSVVLVQPTSVVATTMQKAIDDSSPSLRASSAVSVGNKPEGNKPDTGSGKRSGDSAVQASPTAPTDVQLPSRNMEKSGGKKPETALARKPGDTEVKSPGAAPRNKTKPEGKKQGNTSAKKTGGTSLKKPIAKTPDDSSAVKTKIKAEVNKPGTIQEKGVEVPESRATASVVEFTAKAEVGNAEPTPAHRARGLEVKHSVPSAPADPSAVETSRKTEVNKQDINSIHRPRDLEVKATTSPTVCASPANGNFMNPDLKTPPSGSEQKVSATPIVDATLDAKNNIKPKGQNPSSSLTKVPRYLDVQSSPTIMLNGPSAVQITIKFDGKHPEDLAGGKTQASQDKESLEPASTHSVKTWESAIAAQVLPSTDAAKGFEGNYLPANSSSINSAEISKEPDGAASPRLASADIGEPRTPKRVRPQIPPRTSSLLGSPPAPILTHKKKQRVFTPVKENLGESLPQKPKDGGFESLNRFRLLEPESKEHIESPVEGYYSENHEKLAVILDVTTQSLGEENQAGEQKDEPKALSTAIAAEPPLTEANQPGGQRDDPKGRSASTASQRKKSKHKNAAKKGKGKCKENQASLATVTAVDRTDEVKSRKTNANLPAPETPYLVDDQYILPRIQPPLSQRSELKAISPENIRKTESADIRPLDSLKHLLHPLNDFPGPETAKSWPPIARPILYPAPSCSSDRNFPRAQGSTLRRNSAASTETLKGDQDIKASELRSQNQYSSSESLSELETAPTPPSPGGVQSSSTVKMSSSKDAVLKGSKTKSATLSPQVQKDSSVVMQPLPNPNNAAPGKNPEVTGPKLGDPIVDLTDEASPPTTPRGPDRKGFEPRRSTNVSNNIVEAVPIREPEAYSGNIISRSPKSPPCILEKRPIDLLSKSPSSRTTNLEERLPAELWTTAIMTANTAEFGTDPDGYEVAIVKDREDRKIFRTKDYADRILKDFRDEKVTGPATGEGVPGVETQAYPGNIGLGSINPPQLVPEKRLIDVLSNSHTGRASTTEERLPAALCDTIVMAANAAEFGTDVDGYQVATIKDVEHRKPIRADASGRAITKNIRGGGEIGPATEGENRGSKKNTGRKGARERGSQDDPWSVPQGEKAWKSKSTSPMSN